MPLALSVPFLTDILSRVARTPVDSDATAFLTRPTFLGELEIGSTITLKLRVVGLSPTTLAVTQFVQDRIDLTARVAALRWVMTGAGLKTSDELDYRIRGPRQSTGRQSVIVNGTVLDLIDQSGWSMDSAEPGAFDLLASRANSPTSAAADAARGTVQIGA